jgi:hypothetical protein
MGKDPSCKEAAIVPPVEEEHSKFEEKKTTPKEATCLKRSLSQYRTNILSKTRERQLRRQINPAEENERCRQHSVTSITLRREKLIKSLNLDGLSVGQCEKKVKMKNSRKSGQTLPPEVHNIVQDTN